MVVAVSSIIGICERLYFHTELVEESLDKGLVTGQEKHLKHLSSAVSRAPAWRESHRPQVAVPAITVVGHHPAAITSCGLRQENLNSRAVQAPPVDLQFCEGKARWAEPDVPWSVVSRQQAAAGCRFLIQVIKLTQSLPPSASSNNTTQDVQE